MSRTAASPIKRIGEGDKAGTRYSHDTGRGDAFTGNATAGVEHSTSRMDYRWHQPVRHAEFSPLERGEPAKFYSNTTNGDMFKDPGPVTGPMLSPTKGAPAERPMVAQSTYQADFVKAKQESHADFIPLQRGERSTFYAETTHQAHFDHPVRSEEHVSTMSPLEAQLRTEVSAKGTTRVTPTPQGAKWDIH